MSKPSDFPSTPWLISHALEQRTLHAASRAMQFAVLRIMHVSQAASSSNGAEGIIDADFLVPIWTETGQRSGS